jgi:phosphopantetheinyl transferase
MDFSLENSIVENQHFSVPQVQEMLQYPHILTYVLLDLQLLEQEVNKAGEERIIANNLSRGELDQLGKFALAKRKREWIGGRFAAKFATKRLLEQIKFPKNVRHWSGYTIIVDENGRPFLQADKENIALPVDISISHSASMAATMAVQKGYCGIDIQKVTPQIFKVKDRFCTHGEKQVLEDFFPVGPEQQAAPLTKLWAAKEALRKASNLSSLPGFLELQLIEIKTDTLQKESGPWGFIFNWQTPAGLAHKKCTVAVTCIEEDYALALTVRGDTVA